MEFDLNGSSGITSGSIKVCKLRSYLNWSNYAGNFA